MTTRLIVFLLLVIFAATSTSAQRNKKKSDVQIIEFGKDEGDNSNPTAPLTGYIIKTSPVSFISGWQFVEVEKEMNDFLSLQAGLGITYKPLLASIYSDLTSELEIENNQGGPSDQWFFDYSDDYNDLSIRRFKPGFVVSVSPRLFFNDFAAEGGYFGLKMRYSVQNLEVQMIADGAPNIVRIPDLWQKEKVNRFDIVGHYGYQALYSKLSAEYFIGLGVRFKNQTRQDLGYDQMNNIYNGERQFNTTGLRIEGGIRIGFQL